MPRSFLVKKVKHPIDRWAYREPSSPSEAEPAPPCPPSPPSHQCLSVRYTSKLGKIKGKIVYQWVPSHCGLWGNERADFLAKKGTGILQNFRRDLTFHSAKLEIKKIFRESFRLTASRVARDKPWSTLCKKSHGIPSSPRAAAVAKFRLLTGHDCLCAHLFRFNLVTSPICVLCDTGQDMTAAHLDECSALNDLNCIVKRHWARTHGMRAMIPYLNHWATAALEKSKAPWDVEPLRKDGIIQCPRDKNNNLCNPLKTPSAEDAISAIKLFAFSAKILIIEPVLPYILEEWVSKNSPVKYCQNIRKIGYSILF
ncbi:uncharacterized protein LOC103524116 [Trichonephila clavipes]|nr:uncharacterized protein LOC103524116 [Trichonephila clavipes]